MEDVVGERFRGDVYLSPVLLLFAHHSDDIESIFEVRKLAFQVHIV